MSVFVVRYTHPDTPAWQQHLEAHTQWLLHQLETGALLASGPTQGNQGHQALLVFAVGSREELDELLATDPYAIHHLVTGCEVIAWDPLFGAFQGRSSLPGRLQQASLASLLSGLGGVPVAPAAD